MSPETRQAPTMRHQRQSGKRWIAPQGLIYLPPFFSVTALPGHTTGLGSCWAGLLGSWTGLGLGSRQCRKCWRKLHMQFPEYVSISKWPALHFLFSGPGSTVRMTTPKVMAKFKGRRKAESWMASQKTCGLHARETFICSSHVCEMTSVLRWVSLQLVYCVLKGNVLGCSGTCGLSPCSGLKKLSN